ncbi:MAG: hypothetical protein JWO65_2239 [Sphingomonas bacterium]|jgi:hypothetical protein|nr:hypothetical protein [Sphingomonas bacterium]
MTIASLAFLFRRSRTALAVAAAVSALLAATAMPAAVVPPPITATHFA